MIKSEKQAAAAANDDVHDISSWQPAAAPHNKKSDNIFLGAVADKNKNALWGARTTEQSV